MRRRNELLSLINGTPLLVEPAYSGGILAEAVFALKNVSRSQVEGSEKKIEDYVSQINQSLSAAAAAVGNSSPKRVELISWKSDIIKYGDWWQYGTEDLSQWILSAAYDPSVAALIIDMESGGGSANAVEKPTYAIKIARELKPVIGYAGNGIVASAAYWILSACHEIYTSFESDQVGSIGVYRTMMNMEKFYSSWLQTDVESLYSTTSDEKNKGYRMWSENNQEGGSWLIKNDVDPYKEAFDSEVKSNRPGVKEEALHGAMYRSSEAIAMGLIDGMMSFEDVVNRAFELADTFEQKNTESMNIFGNKKHAKLSTALEAAVESRTPEMVAEANEEIQASGMMLISVEEHAQNQASIEALTAQVSTSNETLNAVATACGLKATEEGFADQSGNAVSLAESVASITEANNQLTAENQTLKAAPAVTSVSTTEEVVESSEEEGVIDPAIADMYTGVDERLKKY